MRYYSSTAAVTALTAGVTNSATSITVDSVAGFPVVYPYTLSIDAENSSKEVIEVTNAAGTVLTVTRGVDGTSGVTHSLGAVVRHDHSARDFRETQEHMADVANPHAVTKTQVGLGNADNTSDANKPVSIAQAAADAVVQASVDAHIADTTDAHDASAISFAPTGTISSTDTQAAVAEVATEYAAADATHAALTAAHGATGVVMGTTNTQTVTNKDMTSTTNTFPAFGLRQTVVFLASGTFTKATYPWLKYVRVRCQAGGGGGGNAGTTGAAEVAIGGGGGGGEYAESVLDASTLSASETVTVGAGGIGATVGVSGGDSSFGAHVIAMGGDGGYDGAATGTAPRMGGTGGLGGTGGTGQIKIKGGTGQGGLAAFSTNVWGGPGGDSHMGRGGVGVHALSAANGINGQAYGGGGGGGANGYSRGTVATGASGAAGVVIVELYG